MEDEGRGEAATEPPFEVVRKAGAGTEFCLFRKVRQTWKRIRAGKWGISCWEKYTKCVRLQHRSLCVRLNCFYPARARRRQTDAKVHVTRERGADTDLRLTLNKGAARTLLHLLAVAVGASGRNYLWEKWEESSARHGGSPGNCDWDSHILLNHWSTSVYFIPNMMQTIYGSKFICSGTALAHFNPFGVHKDEKSVGVATFRFVCQVKRKDKNINTRQKDIFIHPAIFLLSVPSGDIVKAPHKQSGRISWIIDALLWLWHYCRDSLGGRVFVCLPQFQVSFLLEHHLELLKISEEIWPFCLIPV